MIMADADDSYAVSSSGKFVDLRAGFALVVGHHFRAV